jgi:hypothetical protein
MYRGSSLTAPVFPAPLDVAPLTTSVSPLTGYGEAFTSLRDPERAVKVFLDRAAVPGAEVPV